MARILVVDDEVRVRDLICKALSLKNHEAFSVPTVEQALEYIFKESFDLIVVDIKLKTESGIAIVKKIREQRSSLPIVIYSGVLTEDIEKEARLAGANEVFSKSMDVVQLVERLDKISQVGQRFFDKSTPKKEKKILVVDDEEGIRTILNKFFSSKGYKVLLAENGDKAIEAVSKEDISVVLLDIKMPGLDGIETLKRIKELKPQLGVVMLSAYQDEAKVKQSMELGAYSYVLKPCDFLYLELVVSSKLIIAE